MARRVLIGDFGDGTMGLKISLPGYDVLMDDDQDANKFSFNSEWQDIARPVLVGTATPANDLLSGSTITISGRIIAFPATYSVFPQVDVTGVHSGIIWDDHLAIIGANMQTIGARAYIMTDKMALIPPTSSALGGIPDFFFYHVFAGP